MSNGRCIEKVFLNVGQFHFLNRCQFYGSSMLLCMVILGGGRKRHNVLEYRMVLLLELAQDFFMNFCNIKGEAMWAAIGRLN